MSKTAYIFPGQGAQFPGMARSLYENDPGARALMEATNDILGFRITDIMFNGTADDLKATRVTQPAIFLHSVLLAKGLPAPDMAAGHSLGEFSALTAAGALSFEEAYDLFAEEMDAVPTLLTVENGGVWLHRKGDVGGDMLFAAGKRTAVAYRTPMGMLDLEIDTKRVDVFISEDILEIELKYNLIANEELLSEIEMNIRAE